MQVQIKRAKEYIIYKPDFIELLKSFKDTPNIIRKSLMNSESLLQLVKLLQHSNKTIKPPCKTTTIKMLLVDDIQKQAKKFPNFKEIEGKTTEKLELIEKTGIKYLESYTYLNKIIKKIEDDYKIKEGNQYSMQEILNLYIRLRDDEIYVSSLKNTNYFIDFIQIDNSELIEGFCSNSKQAFLRICEKLSGVFRLKNKEICAEFEKKQKEFYFDGKDLESQKNLMKLLNNFASTQNILASSLDSALKIYDEYFSKQQCSIETLLELKQAQMKYKDLITTYLNKSKEFELNLGELEKKLQGRIMEIIGAFKKTIEKVEQTCFFCSISAVKENPEPIFQFLSNESRLLDEIKSRFEWCQTFVSYAKTTNYNSFGDASSEFFNTAEQAFQDTVQFIKEARELWEHIKQWNETQKILKTRPFMQIPYVKIMEQGINLKRFIGIIEKKEANKELSQLFPMLKSDIEANERLIESLSFLQKINILPVYYIEKIQKLLGLKMKNLQFTILNQLKQFQPKKI